LRKSQGSSAREEYMASLERWCTDKAPSPIRKSPIRCGEGAARISSFDAVISSRSAPAKRRGVLIRKPFNAADAIVGPVNIAGTPDRGNSRTDRSCSRGRKRCKRRKRRRRRLLRALRQPNSVRNPFHAGGRFRGFTGSLPLQPARLLAPLYGSDWDTSPATGDFYFQAFNGSVFLPVAGYNYNSDWTPLLAGLSPAGMAASLAARSISTE